MSGIKLDSISYPTNAQIEIEVLLEKPVGVVVGAGNDESYRSKTYAERKVLGMTWKILPTHPETKKEVPCQKNQQARQDDERAKVLFGDRNRHFS